jgi:hypothetical protein
MKKEKVLIREAWDSGSPGMWSTFKEYPPTDEKMGRMPKP